ncbi:MAG: carboxypeptidase regulatory-like domain-containing protein, partial [Elusimicrobiota bacterium]
MKSVKTILAVMMSVIFVSMNVFAATITVNVKDETGATLSGAQVVALIFNEKGDPQSYDSKSPTTKLYTRVGVTDGSGVCTFTNVLTGNNQAQFYSIIVTKQGYSPTVFEYAKGIATPIEPVTSTANVTSVRNVTLTKMPTEATGVGKITLNITLKDPFVRSDLGTTQTVAESTPVLVVGAVMNQANKTEVAYGIAEFTANTGTLEINNVPIASTNTYGAGAFWPIANLRNDTPVSDAITEGVTVGPYLIDFNSQLAMAPERQQTTTQPPASGVSAAGGAFLKGVVLDSSSRPVVGAEVRIYGDIWEHLKQRPEWMGDRSIRTDANGVYAFYDLPAVNCTIYFNISAPGYEGLEWRGTKLPDGRDSGFQYFYISSAPITYAVSFNWSDK